MNKNSYIFNKIHINKPISVIDTMFLKQKTLGKIWVASLIFSLFLLKFPIQLQTFWHKAGKQPANQSTKPSNISFARVQGGAGRWWYNKFRLNASSDISLDQHCTYNKWHYSLVLLLNIVSYLLFHYIMITVKIINLCFNYYTGKNIHVYCYMN